ncbi:MAG: hypothetical protein ACWGQW_12310, partial [bacterium]
MLGNIVGDRVGSMVAERLDGKKTIIAIVSLCMYIFPMVAKLIWPDLNIPIEGDWETAWEYCKIVYDAVTGGGGATLFVVGTSH